MLTSNKTNAFWNLSHSLTLSSKCYLWESWKKELITLLGAEIIKLMLLIIKKENLDRPELLQEDANWDDGLYVMLVK